MTTEPISVRVMTEVDLKPTARAIVRVFREAPNNRPPQVGLRYVEAKCRYHMSSGHSFVLIACKDDDDVVGFVVATASTLPAGLPRKLLLPAIISFLSHPWIIARASLMFLLLRRGLRILLRARTVAAPTSDTSSQPFLSISQIGVVSQHRGKGVAGLLLAELASQATQRGISRLVAQTSESNTAIWQVYEKQGWVQADTQETPGTRHYVWTPQG